ncbi:MAG: molybdopterin molybdotransferase MoeA [Burkholderiaceae bacterium]|nr:molybdopterin molybdotransferase MoeA [Burkholderiaceae bacterium]
MSNPLIDMDEAIARMIASTHSVTETQEMPTLDAFGLVLAKSVLAPMNVPPEDNSAMDGYAVRCADTAKPGATLKIAQRIAAGETGLPLVAGTAARIFTGAPIPPGADAVVMQELCTTSAETVTIQHSPKAGENIRTKGEDILQGTCLITAGTRLTAAHLGLAASVGIAKLPVLRKPRIALFSTGNELKMPGETLACGQIYNSNRFFLLTLLRQLACEVTDLGVVRDDLAATEQALKNAAHDHDLILTCGGVSVGEEDHVKKAVHSQGRLDLWSIAIKPGKPLAFGAIRRRNGSEAYFVGLPGNPVSAYITLLTIVRPFIHKLAGLKPLQLNALTMRADFDWLKPDKRREFLRVQRNPQGGLSLYPQQGSGVLSSLAWADGLVDNPPGKTITKGDIVHYLPLQYLLN